MTLNENLQIIFSGVVALSTVFYSILTWKLVSETRRMREFQITPDINIFFDRGEADPSLIYIVFKNFGLGFAKNVKFEIIKDFKFYDNEAFQLKDKGIIKNGIKMFYPNQSYKFFLTHLPHNYEEKILDNFIFNITFRNLNNKKFNKEINLPLFELKGITKTNPPDNYLGRIAMELTEIKNLLKSKDSVEKECS